MSSYEVGKEYIFDVIKTIETSQGYFVFLVEDSKTHIRATVKAFESQLHPNPTPLQLKCEVKGLDLESSKLILIQDYPLQEGKVLAYDIFRDGVSYDFSYISKTEIGNSILARGIDGNTYTLTAPFNLAKTDYKDGDSISYIYNSSSPMRFVYFITFDDIIQYRILKQHTFEQLRLKDNHSSLIMNKQYEDKQNLWVLSFCNLLEEEYRALINDKKYESALMYGEVLVNIEYWILHSGFLFSFHDKYDETETYAFGKYKRYQIRTKALDLFISGLHIQFINNFSLEISSIDNLGDLNKEKIEIIQYFIYLMEDDYLSVTPILVELGERLGKLGFFKALDTQNISIEKRFVNSIKYTLKGIESENFFKVFFNLESINNFYSRNKIVEDYIALITIYIQILYENELGKEVYLELIKYYRTKALQNKEKSRFVDIKRALYLSKRDFSFLFEKNNSIWKENTFLDTLNSLVDRIRIHPINAVESMKDKRNSKAPLIGCIQDENREGYVVKINNNYAILPTYQIHNSFNFQLDSNPNRNIEVLINLIDEEFCRISLTTPSTDNVFNENTPESIVIGATLKGKVKSIASYGVFVELNKKTDGLLHIGKISDTYIKDLNDYYSKGQIIDVEISSIDGDKITLDARKFNELPNNLDFNRSYDAVIEDILADYLIIRLHKFNYWGKVYKDNISWNCNLNYASYYNRGDKLKVRLESIKQGGTEREFSIKDVLLNPYGTDDISGIFEGQVHSIQTDRILVKSKDFGQFLTYQIVDDIDLYNLSEMDSISFTIKHIDKNTKSIFIDIDMNSIKKFSIEYDLDALDNQINIEVAKSYELYAMLKTQKDDRNNYLNWAKYFYSISNSAQSYYLNFYIVYQEIVNRSKDILKTSVSDKSFQEGLKQILEDAKQLVNEIDAKDLTTKIFPQLEDLKTSLNVISYFKEKGKEALAYLFNIVNEDTYQEKMNIQLAKMVLAYNLESSEIKNLQAKRAKWQIVTNILDEGLINQEKISYVNKDLQELIQLIKKGETQETEFKSSLFTPIITESDLREMEKLEQLISQKDANNNPEYIQNKIQNIKEKTSNKQISKAVIHTAMKSIVAFANADGGNLIIGVSDDKQIIGIAPDFKQLGNKEDKYDAFKLRFDQIVKDYIGLTFSSSFLATEFHEIDKESVFWVKVKPNRIEPTFLKLDDKGNPDSSIWVRSQASSNQIKGSEEVIKFYKQFHQK